MKTPYLLIFLVLIISSCNNDDNNFTTDYYSISGHAQKGPFINGSNIVVYELDENYVQTGKSFMATTGVSGEFELTNIPLTSPYIGIIADGFYFNENTGSLSSERLSLKGIADISDGSTININIMTHLEYDRVKYLISKKDYSIQEAKTQAQQEILSLFNFDEPDPENAEILDISNTGKGDAILLAISSILQGNHTTAELSKLMADFITDTKEDGILNDTLIQSIIAGQAITLNCEKIKQNLIDKYAELGLTFSVDNSFDSYIEHFIATTNFSSSSPFKFPASSIYGINLLDPELLNIQPNSDYSFAVEIPGSGCITIKMQLTEGEGVWLYQPFKSIGWSVSQFSNKKQTFTSNLNGTIIDLPIKFANKGKANVEYFFNESETPALSKTISWGFEENAIFQFPDISPAGLNLLNIANNTEIISDTTYTVGLLKVGLWDINFTLTYPEGISVETLGGYGIFSSNAKDSQFDFKLEGKDEGDFISEIILRIEGKGEINLSSNELEVSEGIFFNKTFKMK